mmetsp:Transcript_34625/g.79732  ORF Transcript_34625/g.79732 Transcript_34625/m.79732 type:complete len:291 (+) Transcript_34625:45-917(+)
MAGAWLEVEQVLDREEALALRRETEAELGNPKFVEKVAQAMAAGELRYEGKVLFLLGPSAAGKSTALAEGWLKVPSGAMVVDGNTIRQQSESWQKVADLARARGLAGLSDYFEDYFKTPMDKVKKMILRDAIRRQTNVIVPDTASDFSGTKATMQKFIDAGYSLSFSAVYGDEAVILGRGKARATEDGKQFTGKNWRKSVQTILSLQDHLEETGLIADSGSVQVLDNSETKMRPMSLPELRRRLREPEAKQFVPFRDLIQCFLPIFQRCFSWMTVSLRARSNSMSMPGPS